MEFLSRSAAWVDDLGWRISGSGLDNGVMLSELLLTLLLAFVCGQLVAWTYTWSHRGLSYSREFVQSLLLVSMIVGLVMVVVGDSLARAFGLMGALAIIRFRTAVRDTRDIAFVFLALAAGIAAGSRHYLTAFVGTPTICLIAGWLTMIGFGGRHEVEAFLRVCLPEGTAFQPILHRALRRYCRSYSFVSATTSPDGAGREHAFQLLLHDKDLFDPMMRELDSIDETSSVDLMIQETQGNS